MMKITELRAVDEKGVTHVFEGYGFLMTTTEQEKTAAMAKVVGLSVEAKLVVPK